MFPACLFRSLPHSSIVDTHSGLSCFYVLLSSSLSSSSFPSIKFWSNLCARRHHHLLTRPARPVSPVYTFVSLIVKQFTTPPREVDAVASTSWNPPQSSRGRFLHAPSDFSVFEVSNWQTMTTTTTTAMNQQSRGWLLTARRGNGGEAGTCWVDEFASMLNGKSHTAWLTVMRLEVVFFKPLYWLMYVFK